MKRSLAGILPAIAVILLAALLRLPNLDIRTMHGDEAVHALKFGELLEQGTYRYDPFEYHGPTLNYLTLIPAWLASDATLVDVSETTLRVVPALCGILLIILLFLFVDGLGRPVVLGAALLTAVSPVMVYYSRYYIQEILLVLFTVGMLVAGYGYCRRKRGGWALLLGLFLGLMHATKESFVIPVFAAFVALAVLAVSHKAVFSAYWQATKSVFVKHLTLCILAFIAASGVFYSSFFSHPSGVIDALLSYETYWNRGLNPNLHEHPWHYYLGLLTYFRVGDGPVWSEAFVLILSVVGYVLAWRRRESQGGHWLLVRFVSIFAMVQLVIFSALSYKTPWNLLLFYQGLIILAAVGLVGILDLAENRPARRLVRGVVVLGLFLLGYQAYRASFIDFEDSANPYVYAHPVSEVQEMADRVVEYARVHPQGLNMYVQVISPDHDYWPLPWYLRSLTRVGYWARIDDTAPPAPLILAPPAFESKLIARLYDRRDPGAQALYVPAFEDEYLLRPGVSLRGYVTKELWDRLADPALRQPQ